MIDYSFVQNTFQPLLTATSSLSNTVINFCNTGAVVNSGEIIDICIVKNGETPQLVNTVIKELTIPSKETFEYSAERFILSVGDSIYVSGSIGNNTAAFISWLSLT